MKELADVFAWGTVIVVLFEAGLRIFHVRPERTGECMSVAFLMALLAFSIGSIAPYW